MIYEQHFLLALIITVILETITLFVIIRKLFKLKEKQIKNKELVFAGFIASFSTLPYLWFIFPIIIQSSFWYVLIGEILAIIAETIIYYFILKLSIKKVLVISILCNIISFILGFIIIRLIV